MRGAVKRKDVTQGGSYKANVKRKGSKNIWDKKTDRKMCGGMARAIGSILDITGVLDLARCLSATCQCLCRIHSCQSEKKGSTDI